MSESLEKNGWNEWSKHIIKELERLNTAAEKLRDEIAKSNTEITRLQGLEKEISELKYDINSVKKEISNSSMQFDIKVEKKIRELLEVISNNVEGVEKSVIDMESSLEGVHLRLRKLENYRYYLWGVGATVFLIVTTIISFLAMFDWGKLTN